MASHRTHIAIAIAPDGQVSLLYAGPSADAAVDTFAKVPQGHTWEWFKNPLPRKRLVQDGKTPYPKPRSAPASKPASSDPPKKQAKKQATETK